MVRLVSRWVIVLIMAAAVPRLAVAQEYSLVYVYHLGLDAGGIVPKPSVFVNGKRIAQLRKGTFFLAKLAPGTHVLDAGEKKLAVTVEVRAGQEYYYRVEYLLKCCKLRAEISPVEAAQGSVTLQKLMPIEQGLITDKTLVATARPADWRPRPTGLTNTDIITLQQSGFSETFLLSEIERLPAQYTFDEASLDALRRANVSEPVIEAMRRAEGRH